MCNHVLGPAARLETKIWVEDIKLAYFEWRSGSDLFLVLPFLALILARRVPAVRDGLCRAMAL